jgi:carboxyl-terminal processing protease
LKLTVARYYTPNGRSIQAQGIEPDVRIEQAELSGDGAAGLSEASLEGHLTAESQTQAVELERSKRRGRAEQPTSRGPFLDDFQANTAYQTLRAVSLDRAQRAPTGG